MFTRHGAINSVIAEAGRAAGYTAYCEQVVPELCQVMVLSTGVVKVKEARIDVELFGHAYAPSHLVDGTVKHPAAASHVRRASQEIGYTAQEGEKAKKKRYPPAHGKSVLAGSMETWGRTSESFDSLLKDLAVLASRRQRERGMQPTKWLIKWQTQLSMNVAIHIGRALFDALSHDRKRDYFTRQSLSTHFDGADILADDLREDGGVEFSETDGIAGDGMAGGPLERDSG